MSEYYDLELEFENTERMLALQEKMEYEAERFSEYFMTLEEWQKKQEGLQRDILEDIAREKELKKRYPHLVVNEDMSCELREEELQEVRSRRLEIHLDLLRKTYGRN